MKKRKAVFADRRHIEGLYDSLDFSSIEKLVDLEIIQCKNANELFGRVGDVDIIITGKLKLSSEDLDIFPSLQLVMKAGIGVDKIDCDYAAQKEIIVANLPGFSSRIVAQSTVALMLAQGLNIVRYNEQVNAGKWAESQYKYPVIDLYKKTIGIIGLGNISRHVISMLQPYEAEILVHTNYPDSSLNVSYEDLTTIAEHSDIISLHNRLTADTRGMIDKSFFNAMKPSAFLVNTARPALINEDDIVTALSENKIAGLAMDGFWREPAEASHPLYDMPQVTITPHVTWVAHSIRQGMIESIAETISNFLNKKELSNRVN